LQIFHKILYLHQNHKNNYCFMNKSVMLLLGASLVMASCGTYTTTGAVVGGEFGHVVGSAIGGISGGWRGAHTGSLIGTLGGVIAGAAVGAAVDNAQNRTYEERGYDDGGYGQRRHPYDQHPYDQHPYEQRSSNQVSYDDRIEMEPQSASTSVARSEGFSIKPLIELRNARIYDSDNDGVLSRGEQCTVVFEIMNNGTSTIYDISPIVEDVTGNKHVKVSPNLLVESIAPHRGVRYTATILADNSLKDGEIVVRLGVAQGKNVITSQSQQYTIPTRKRSLKR
jgi:hypothetical protein